MAWTSAPRIHVCPGLSLPGNWWSRSRRRRMSWRGWRSGLPRSISRVGGSMTLFYRHPDSEAYQAASDRVQAQAAALARGAERLRSQWNCNRSETARTTRPTRRNCTPNPTAGEPCPPANSSLSWSRWPPRRPAPATRHRRNCAPRPTRTITMANRVYGKVAETDDEAKPIECLHHRAAVLRAYADQPEREAAD